MKLDAKSTIEAGKAILGIQLGSTRIKAVLIDQEKQTHRPGKPYLGESVSRRTCGHIASRLSGMGCRIATQTFVPM